MCESKVLCNVIAYLSAIGYGLGTLAMAFILCTSAYFVGAVQSEDSGLDQQSTEDLTIVGGLFVAASAIEFVRCLSMFIISIFLILGIKRDHHRYICPWVYMTLISMAWSVLGVIIFQRKTALQIGISVVVVVVNIACWYPIFALYRRLRKPRYPPTSQPEQYPLNTGYNAYPPTNGAQPQTNAPYPTGAYAPQSQPAVYNPSTQPLYPSVPNASGYPEKQ